MRCTDAVILEALLAFAVDVTKPESLSAESQRGSNVCASDSESAAMRIRNYPFMWEKRGKSP